MIELFIMSDSTNSSLFLGFEATIDGMLVLLDDEGREVDDCASVFET